MEEQPSKTPEENAGNKPEKQNPINDPEKSGNSRSGSKKAAVWFVFVVFLDVLVGIAAYVFGGWWMDAFWLVAGVSIYELLEKHLKILKTNLVLLVVAAVLNVFLFIDIILDSGNGVSAEWCWLAVAINAGISIYMLIRLLKAHLILKAWKPLDILAGLLAECMVLCFIICVVRYKVWYAWFFFALFSGTFFYNLLRLLRRLRILKTGKGTAVIFGLIIFVSIFLQAFNPYVIDSLDGKDVARRRIEWIEKADPEVKKAVVHMEKTDLKYPTVKDAVMAARCADIEALSVMKKNGFTNWDDPEIMLAACKTPFLVNVKMISRFGGDVNASDKDGVTALMFAARAGNVEIVKYLVSRGAYVNAKRKEEPFMGKTVLMYAAESGNIETVKYLVSLGADVKAKTNKGTTVLMFAAQSGNIETVKYLVSLGADVKAKDKDGKTALDHAKGECKDYLQSVAK